MNEIPLPCCVVLAGNLGDLKIHQAWHHGIKKVFVCQDCNERFPTRDHAFTHRLKAHFGYKLEAENKQENCNQEVLSNAKEYVGQNSDDSPLNLSVASKDISEESRKKKTALRNPESIRKYVPTCSVPKQRNHINWDDIDINHDRGNIENHQSKDKQMFQSNNYLLRTKIKNGTSSQDVAMSPHKKNGQRQGCLKGEPSLEDKHIFQATNSLLRAKFIDEAKKRPSSTQIPLTSASSSSYCHSSPTQKKHRFGQFATAPPPVTSPYSHYEPRALPVRHSLSMQGFHEDDHAKAQEADLKLEAPFESPLIARSYPKPKPVTKTSMELPMPEKTDPASSPLDSRDKSRLQCDICNKFFPSKQSLGAHQWNGHKAEMIRRSGERFECPDCNLTYASKRSWRNHKSR